MRTNPPGGVREEGEGKKPTVVGEPGGLQQGEKGRGGREGRGEGGAERMRIRMTT